MRATATLGELISSLYEEYLKHYGDTDLASVAAAATVNDLLVRALGRPDEPEADAA
jgi:hypothetical protein